MAQQKFWIFQANQSYRIVDALNDLEQISWVVTRFAKIIQKHDPVLIWKAGNNAGIYALAKTISKPDWGKETEIERQYWIDEKKRTNKPEIEFLVKLKIEKKFTGNPILKDTIKSDEILQSLPVIKSPQGTNFSLTADQWMHIQKYLQ